MQNHRPYDRAYPIFIVTTFVLSVLSVAAGSITVDNEVIGEPEVVCGGDFLGLHWKTRSTFLGHVFVKGRYLDTPCRTDETERKEASIKIPLSECGVQKTRSADPRGLYANVTVIITFHQQFLTTTDRAYAVRCFYMEADKIISAELEVSMLATALHTKNVTMPRCRYDVLAKGPEGAPVKFANIGDQVYHRWTCKTDFVDIFCMTVHTCTVASGFGSEVLLIDSNGCAQDKYLLGNLKYFDDLTAGRESHVFKSIDRLSLYFNCQISLAIKEKGEQCQRHECQEPTRGKRDASTSAQENRYEIESFKNIENETKRTGMLAGRRATDDICMSLATTVAYIGVNFCLFVSSLYLLFSSLRNFHMSRSSTAMSERNAR